jgi:hypothetical protein
MSDLAIGLMLGVVLPVIGGLVFGWLLSRDIR